MFVEPEEYPRVARCFADAFAADPLLHYFFADHPMGHQIAAEQFFSILLRSRIATGMPVILARDEHGHVQGGAMGYDTAAPAWPESLQHEWAQLEASAVGVKERFAEYERISRVWTPPTPHYYLGVIAVDPLSRGAGWGSRLLLEFCQLSLHDPLSRGVYLETANPANLSFYARHGFRVLGSECLGSGHLWCLYLEHPVA